VIALFVAWGVSQVALGKVLDHALWLRDPLYGDKELKLHARVAERTTAGDRPLTVVMVGSSRTCYGLRGEIVEDRLAGQADRPVVAFNFGVPAAGPVANLITLRRLLRRGARPDWVLLEVMPPLLAGQHPIQPEERLLEPERLRRHEVPLVVAHGFSASLVGGRSRLAALTPVYGLRFPLVGRLMHSWLPWGLRYEVSRVTDATGWLRPVNEPVTPEARRRGARYARSSYFHLLTDMRLDGPAARAVGESLDLCRRHGVRAALVLMPEGTEFRSWYSPAVEAAVYAFLRDLSQSRGAPLIEARTWLDDECFLDSHHLLTAGAVAFSDRLGRELGPIVCGEGATGRP
jgi:hypothetical protein